MEQSNSSKKVIVLAALVIIVLLYLFISKPAYFTNLFISKVPQETSEVIIQNTALVGGALPAPTGLPGDLPVENGSILESNTVTFPTRNAKQLGVSYRSKMSVSEKFDEYMKYFNDHGYAVTEGSHNSSVKTIFGTKDNLRLSVAVSRPDDETLVQLSYFMTSL